MFRYVFLPGDARPPTPFPPWPRPAGSLSVDEKFEVQELLQKRGFYSGGIDGRIGTNTRKGIKAFQLQYGLAGDGKASQDVLKALRQ